MRSTTTDAAAFHSALLQRAGLSEPELERVGRAEEVKATYSMTPCATGTWYVQHPTEDERAYLVDVFAQTCQCLDWMCRGKDAGFRCKHMLALELAAGVIFEATESVIVEAFRSPRWEICVQVPYDSSVVQQLKWMRGTWVKNGKHWRLASSGRVALLLSELFGPMDTNPEFDRLLAGMRKLVNQGKVVLPHIGDHSEEPDFYYI